MFLEEDGEGHSGQYGVAIFTLRRRRAALKISKVDFSYAQCNCWDHNLPKYWFYVKVGFWVPNSSDIRYPFAGPMGDVELKTVVEFNKRSKGYKKNYPCFIHATKRLTSRDVVEEFICWDLAHWHFLEIL